MNTNILTFDIEEWFIYNKLSKGKKSYYEPILEDYLNILLDKLDTVNTQATFFCLGYIARNQPHIIRKIFDRGHEIGCHSDKHELLTNMSEEEFRKDTKTAIDSIQQVIGNKVEYYRAPAFSITEKNKWTLRVLVEEGITCDSSIFPTDRNSGGYKNFQSSSPVIISIEDLNLLEFPMNYIDLLGKRLMFTGGGYFRVIPYYFIKNLTKKSAYNMTYFHLRDFDSEQKKISPFFSKEYFFSYYGINTSLDKFDSYINDFQFTSLGQAIAEVKKSDIPLIEL